MDFFETPYRISDITYPSSDVKEVSVQDLIEQGYLREIELNILEIVYRFRYISRLQIEWEYTVSYGCDIRDIKKILHMLSECYLLQIILKDSYQIYTTTPSLNQYMEHIGVTSWLPQIGQTPRQIIGDMVLHQFCMLWDPLTRQRTTDHELKKEIQGVYGTLVIDGYYSILQDGIAVFFYVFVIREGDHLLPILNKLTNYTKGVLNSYALFICEDRMHLLRVWEETHSLFRCLYTYDTLLDDPDTFLVNVESRDVIHFGSLC